MISTTILLVGHGSRNRDGNRETLHFAAPHFGQYLGLLLGLHALGDRSDTERAGEIGRAAGGCGAGE